MYEKNNIYFFSILKKYPNVIHGISTRAFGPIRRDGAIVENNLRNFLDALGIRRNGFIIGKQVHGNDVKLIDASNIGDNEEYQNVDGFITKLTDTFLGIYVADCFPLLFYDPQNKIVASIHVGYKGLLNGIIETALLEFKNLGSETKNIIVGVGPGIGVCCYNVPKERIDKFPKKYPYINNYYIAKHKEYFLDLGKIITQVLVAEGILRKNIENSNLCTKSNRDKLFSYRDDNKENFGMMISIIGMKNRL